MCVRVWVCVCNELCAGFNEETPFLVLKSLTIAHTQFVTLLVNGQLEKC